MLRLMTTVNVDDIAAQLVATVTNHVHSVTTVERIPAHLIVAGNNDRKAFDPAALKQLADSIKASGLAQPPTVRPLPDGRYQLVAGERRFRACTEILQWLEVPCHVRPLSDDEAADIMLAENEARADLDPIEQANAYRSRLNTGSTVAELSERCGIPRARIESRMRLLQLADDVQHLVGSGNLTLRDADAICHLDSNRQHLALAGLQSGLDTRGFTVLVARLTVEQQQDSMFDADAFWQVEEYVVTARRTAATEQLSMFAAQAAEAIRLRDAGIRAMRADGATLQAIADAVGLSHVAVRKITMRTS
jgi:ParB/RepB/Spo0J family partition protein